MNRTVLVAIEETSIKGFHLFDGRCTHFHQGTRQNLVVDGIRSGKTGSGLIQHSGVRDEAGLGLDKTESRI
ncbi:MAG: hypothetical protein HN580_01425 [Deltaproteobacteria bacterium]|jgi:hypothetical protein|nr:hypothetical protein [Deltaproteobacteria bacterium]MBT6502528.1 hypothetical protein [Deltaproteobacteria bacterium]MBT7155169.1 hypothetical protein [Deltaproteobacteria bacterium]MBT7887661.1 hypothetical protein [Deltaproteobacteria bacterium]